MARYDYRCDGCEKVWVDIEQPIGSDALPRCPEGHDWRRLISRVRIDPSFKGRASLSPQMETFWETGDPELAFPPGIPDADAFTLDDLSDDMIEHNIIPDHPKDWISTDEKGRVLPAKTPKAPLPSPRVPSS